MRVHVIRAITGFFANVIKSLLCFNMRSVEIIIVVNISKNLVVKVQRISVLSFLHVWMLDVGTIIDVEVNVINVHLYGIEYLSLAFSESFTLNYF